MSGLQWHKAKNTVKPKLSVKDEGEYRERDAAARWLERNAKKPTGKRQKGRRA